MNSMIENFINGNLTDAKKQAESYSVHAIYRFLMIRLGWSQDRADAVSNYLKGLGSFQAACDAV